jgi:hypothetical protein
MSSLSIYISISLSIYVLSRNAICQSSKKHMKNLKSVVLSGQKVLTGQSLAGPNNVWLAQTMSGQSWVQGYLNPESLPSSSSSSSSSSPSLSLSHTQPVVGVSSLPTPVTKVLKGE